MFRRFIKEIHISTYISIFIIEQTSSEVTNRSEIDLEGDNAVGRKKLEYKLAESIPVYNEKNLNLNLAELDIKYQNKNTQITFNNSIITPN